MTFCWGIGFADPQIEEDISQSFTGFTVDIYIYRSLTVQINLYRRKRYQALIAYYYNLLQLYLPLKSICQAGLFHRQIWFLLATPTINASYATPHQDVHDMGIWSVSYPSEWCLCWLLAYLGSFYPWIYYQFNPIYARNLFTPSHTHHALVESKTPKTPKFEVI